MERLQERSGRNEPEADVVQYSRGEGAVKGCPARLAVWYDKNEMSFCGELQMDQRGPQDYWRLWNSEMASKFKAYASGLVHASSQRATLSCIHGITALGYGETRAVCQGSSRQGKRSHSFFIFSR